MYNIHFFLNRLNLSGLILGEIRSLWSDGLMEYISDLWNIVDFVQNIFYVIWIMLRITAWIIVQVYIFFLFLKFLTFVPFNMIVIVWFDHSPYRKSTEMGWILGIPETNGTLSIPCFCPRELSPLGWFSGAMQSYPNFFIRDIIKISLWKTNSWKKNYSFPI